MTQYLSLDVLFFFQTNSPVEELEEVINLLIEGVKIKQCCLVLIGHFSTNFCSPKFWCMFLEDWQYNDSNDILRTNLFWVRIRTLNRPILGPAFPYYSHTTPLEVQGKGSDDGVRGVPTCRPGVLAEIPNKLVVGLPRRRLH